MMIKLLRKSTKKKNWKELRKNKLMEDTENQ